MKLDILTLVIILSFFFFAMELNIFAIDKEVIKEIKITGNRVKESIIRKALVFKEGDILNQEDIEKSKKNLFRLKLFKSLEIKKEWVEESNGIRIIINVEDGWFIAPMPMIMQGGERSLGLMLMEQNIFRNAENIMLMGINQQAGLSGMANINLYNCFSFSFSGLRFSTEEYLYKDGAYNAKQFIKDNEGKFIEDPEEYGEINNQYEKELYQLNLSIGLPLSKKMGCSVSYISNNIKYSNALVSLPADNGKINSLLLSVGFGERDPEEEFLKGDITSGIGRIFGLGMAEIKDSLKTTYKSNITMQYQISIERGDKILSSDFEYTKISVGIGQRTSFRKRNSITLSLKSAIGFDLPFSQMFATNQKEGLRGFYAREYRGDKIIISNVTYSHPFFRSRKGFLNSEIFINYAVCGMDNNYWEKEGIGFDISYHFWRFPLPIGFGYTYSIDDKNWQTIFSVGGRF